MGQGQGNKRAARPLNPVSEMHARVEGMERVANRVFWRRALVEWKEAAWRAYQHRRQIEAEREIERSTRAHRDHHD